jgi:uncharacterized protein (TIGR02246 family)
MQEELMAVLSWSLRLIVRLARLVSVALILLSPAAVLAGPGEDANAVIDQWSAAYSSNDPEAVVKTYRPDAILLGTASPIMSEGTDAIRAYFARLKGSGNKNTIGARRTLVLSDTAVLVTGFYEFTRAKEGKPVPSPARFTMLLIKHDDEWLIHHHHSSPRAQQ